MENVSDRHELNVDEMREAAVLFTLLGRAFHGVPDRELLAGLANERAFDDVPFATGPDASEAQQTLRAWNDRCSVPFSDEDYHRLSSEYTRLFVGGKRVVAPMWESVYFNKDRMVFQHETFEVRAMYARYGLKVDAFSHEPDDHLAYELLFLGRLFEQAADDEEAGRGEEARRKVADAVSFTVCHPLTWVPQWRALVERHDQSGFYRGYAHLVEAALRQVERAFADRGDLQRVA
ncbi:MAG: molecular chaperone TorD family protein [Adlercreutzia sp.]|nr:molecular chaperone TorD family protein [Adlercreutzia sp.]